MKKITVIFILFLIFICSLFKEVFSVNIPEDWIYSVVYINNPSIQKAGTGFLVSRRISQDRVKVFLISNKHVLEPKNIENETNVDLEVKAEVYINVAKENDIAVSKIEVILRDKEGKVYLKKHPQNYVDVAALDITNYISENNILKEGLKIGYIPEESFATKERIREDFVTVGDKVTVLGYPLNLVEGGHCIAIGRGGVIASDPVRDFKKMPAILIDSTMVRGSSGSPVFLPFLTYKFTAPKTVNQFQTTQARLLGIVASLIPDWSMEIKKTVTFGAEPETVSVIAVANLGLLFKAETITETIDLFGYTPWHSPPKEESKPESNLLKKHKSPTKEINN